MSQPVVDIIASSIDKHFHQSYDGIWLDRDTLLYMAEAITADLTERNLLSDGRVSAKDLLAEFQEKKLKTTPIGHETPTRGCSTYNWRMWILDEMQKLEADMAKDINSN